MSEFLTQQHLEVFERELFAVKRIRITGTFRIDLAVRGRNDQEPVFGQ